MKKIAAKAPRGRPRKAASVKQSKCIMVRVTPDEYQMLKIEGAKKGLALSALLMLPLRKRKRK